MPHVNIGVKYLKKTVVLYLINFSVIVECRVIGHVYMFWCHIYAMLRVVFSVVSSQVQQS